ncbi:charged multivesicular body protein [Holotrichia oblita]|uniref:Charged multivesicular body protein n=1 Tax=Holotrichia oblita TaxID=644536 RepID=A0ACB9SUA5_HOLOL|nr:charged multivesicular body protein [Holotrichia oblita]
MGLIFGKKKQVSRITEQDKAVLQLKQQRDKLKQYHKRIGICLEKDREVAKKLLNNGQRERAKLLLRKKRYQEQLLQRTENQLENLEKMTHDIEFAQIEIQVVNGLKRGNEALKKLNDALSIEDVERILDETREGIEKQQEIDSLLSGVLTSEDEDAVLSELDSLIAESLPEVPSEDKMDVNLPELPEVPSEPMKGSLYKITLEIYLVLYFSEKKPVKKVPEQVALEA